MKARKFRKYFGFVKADILITYSYKFKMYGWLIGSCLTVAMTCVLWYAIFKQSTTAVINGFTFYEMITYAITSQLVIQLVASSQSFWIISDDIRKGTIAINLTKPINYRTRLLSESFGAFVGAFIFLFIPLYLICIISLYFGANAPIPTWYNVLYFLVSIVISLSILDAFNFLIGQLAFFTGAEFGIMIMKDTILSFLSGAMITISFFPDWLALTLRILPFASITEMPVFFLMNRYTPVEGITNLCIALGWAIVLNAISYFSYSKIAKHVISTGG